MTAIQFIAALRQHRILTLVLSALALSAISLTTQAADFEETLLDIQHRWAEANYRETGKSQKRAFKELLGDARSLSSAYPDRAEALIWHGIVASTYAGVKGPFGAMSLAKEARNTLTSAETLDPSALDGSVYTSLGTLYYKVPGGVIGFGDKKLAEKYLQKALEANPNGIDPNFFYGEFLFEEKEYAAAHQVLLKAQQAPKRSHHALADEGRQEEISALLAKVTQKLGQAS